MSKAMAVELLAEMIKEIQSDSDCFTGFELHIDPIQQWPRLKRLSVTISLRNAEGENIYSALLPESEGPSSEAITSTETSGLPARQSGSPEVDPSGERQKYLPCEVVFKGKDCKYTGPVQTCDKTYESCRSMLNLPNFRGMPVSLPPEERGLPRVTVYPPMSPVKEPKK